MVGRSGRIFQRRSEFAIFQQRTIRQNFDAIRAGRRRIEHVADRYAQAAQAWAATAWVRVCRYALQFAYRPLP